ncbi:MAG: cell division topological specificity factor MinE [Desulfatirhabdiaceae bacterium]
MFNGFLKKIFGREKSGNQAKQRLQFALIYDKLEISDDILTRLQQDIIEVISRYFEIDKNSLQLDIKKSEGRSALVVNTPILSAKRLQPIIAAENRKESKFHIKKKKKF